MKASHAGRGPGRRYVPPPWRRWSRPQRLASACRRSTGPAILGAALVALGGCYTYETVRPDELAPGRYLRAELRDAAPASGGLLLRSAAYSVEGALVDWNDDVVRLEVIRPDPQRPTMALAVRDTVALSWNYVQRLDAKRLARGRTAVFIAASAAAGGLLIKYLFDQWAGGGSRPPGGGPAESRSPI